MTTSVQIIHPDASHQSIPLVVKDEAAKLVRMKFNPSGMSAVNDLKAIGGAFITLCQEIQRTGTPEAKREAAAAITLMQQASMMAVAAATNHLA
jgi:hypothetical protein